MSERPSALSLNAAEVQAMRRRLEQAFEARIAAGLLPYEGEWIRGDEVVNRQVADDRRAERQFWELLIALAIFALAGSVVLLIIGAILY